MFFFPLPEVDQLNGRSKILLSTTPGQVLQVRSIVPKLVLPPFLVAGALLDQSMEKVKQVFNINTFAIIRVCRAVLPVMAKHKKGLFVNIGSVVGDTCVDVFKTIHMDV